MGGTAKLLTSFDTFIAWRPWWLKEDLCWNELGESSQPSTWRPSVENLHVDRNPFFRVGRTVVQGMIPLYPVGRDVGGLQVVPNSPDQRLEWEQDMRVLYPEVSKRKSDWLELHDKDPRMGTGQFVKAEAGDLILWDSRTIHGGYIGPATEAKESMQEARLARLSLTVCQTPYSSMERGMESTIIESRWVAFSDKVCTSLTPHEYAEAHTVNRMMVNSFEAPSNQAIEMTDAIRDLIGNVELIQPKP